jgi:hypothetical protein
MRTTTFALQAIVALAASCCLTASDDSTPFTAYLEVKIVSSTGIGAVRGAYPGSVTSGQDVDPAPDRLLVTDAGQGGWYFIWFESPNGGEVTFRLRTRAVNLTFSNCRIDPNHEFGPSSLDAIMSIALPEGQFDPSDMTRCKSVR